METPTKKTSRSLILLSLIIAGETIFFLPFVIPRIFRPTLLAVFDISNTQLGTYFSVYGIVAVFSYFFGGPLADKFPSRNLMSIALWLTSLGGFFIWLSPLNGNMMLIYGFWGVTTILLFWAALIRSTREWGGTESQGRAFGWLEGGRGAIAASLGTLALFVFSDFSPDTVQQADMAGERIIAFRNVILISSALTMISGVLVWFFIPDNKEYRPADRVRMSHLVILIKKPSIWLISVIISSAYIGYKTSDVLSLYANDVLNYNEVASAAIGTGALWLRALVAILAGYLADRVKVSKIIRFSFALAFVGALLFALGVLEQIYVLVFINLVMLMIAVYGLKALYFALIQEAGLQIIYTGTAVGLISILGFTPDIFWGPWMGYLLDNNPGAEGHRKVFTVLALFSLVGLMASFAFINNTRGGRKRPKT